MLSNTPKDTLTAIQMVADFTEAFKLVAANPDIGALAKAAYSLPEAEQKKADTARAQIDANRAILADIRKEHEEIDRANADLADKQKKHSETLALITEENRKLDARKIFLDGTERSLGDLKTVLDKRERDLAAKEAKLAEDQASLKVTQKEADRMLSEIKARASQLKGITEGL